MKKPEIVFDLECLPEDMPVRGNAQASGDDADDKAVEDAILAELERGNDWAWCTVKVTATVDVNGFAFEGADYLGGCSYASEEDFRRCDYFADMKESALERLRESLRHAAARGEIAASIARVL